MKSSDSTGSGKLERKTVEKNRRVHMKNLCMKLSSLIPKDHIPSSKDACTQLDSLDQAASYIVKLKDRLELLRQEREMATSLSSPPSSSSTNGKRKDLHASAAGAGDVGQVVAGGCGGAAGRGGGFMIRLPVVEVRQQETNLEVVLISGLRKTFKLHQVIGIIEEEGGEVVNASFSVVGDKIYHTIHAQALGSRTGLNAAKVSERLEELIR